MLCRREAELGIAAHARASHGIRIGSDFDVTRLLAPAGETGLAHLRLDTVGKETLAIVGDQGAPRSTPHKLCALSKIAANTGARSPGEELMTCKTSAIAVSRARKLTTTRPRVWYGEDRRA
jgi:hypothetical protein